MKLLTFIFSMLLLAAFMTAGGQTPAAGSYQTVSETGVWTSAAGKTLGYVDTTGFLKDSNHVAFGSVQKVPNNPGMYVFKDAEGKELATILEDGSVRSIRGVVLYTLFPPNAGGYCRVYNEAGKVVGMVHEHYKFSGVCLMENANIKVGLNTPAMQRSAR